MGKDKKKNKSDKKDSKSEQIKVNKRFTAGLNVYKGKSYCHLSDTTSKKYVSLNRENLKKFKKAIPGIEEKMKKMEEEEASDSSSCSASDSD